MFAVTVINFLLFSLNTGRQVAAFIVYIRTALVLDIDYPLSGKPDLVKLALNNLNVVFGWAAYLPVSIKLSPSDPVSIHARCWLGEGIFQRSHCHLEGVGHLPRSTVGGPHTICSVDWSRR